MKSDSGHVLKVEPYKNHADGPDMRMKERVDPRRTPSVLA